MLTLMDWFCGLGGSSHGAAAVPGVVTTLAANHWKVAVDSHQANFPDADHYMGDIRTAPVHQWPVADLFWASPECPNWSNARGKRRDFDATAQPALFETRSNDERAADAEAERSRALMEEVPQYLEGVQRRGKLVLAGVVENVVDVRAWDRWDWWLGRLHNLGYRSRVIAFNSMHAQDTTSPTCPQSRDRLYVAYWHQSLGRDPDWDRWLRPRAYCPGCDDTVYAIQSFKKTGADMGRYRQSYVYRCPRTSCRNDIVEPDVLPASSAIDWSIKGKRIGDRDRPLAAATLSRIRVGMDRYWAPLLVPVEGRDGKNASITDVPLRTQTTRNETGLALPPFIVPMRGGGDRQRARPITAPLSTVSAGGNHHGLVETDSLLVPYYGNGTAAPVHQPLGALTTRDRYAVATPATSINDVLFRMLTPAEISRAMAFARDYIITGTKRQQVRQLGNAVTPPVAELLIKALVETINGDAYTKAA